MRYYRLLKVRIYSWYVHMIKSWRTEWIWMPKSTVYLLLVLLFEVILSYSPLHNDAVIVNQHQIFFCRFRNEEGKSLVRGQRIGLHSTHMACIQLFGQLTKKTVASNMHFSSQTGHGTVSSCSRPSAAFQQRCERAAECVTSPRMSHSSNLLDEA